MEDRRIRRPNIIFEASELPVATENSKRKKRDVYKRLSTQINRDLEINWDANEARYNSLLIDEKISFAKNGYRFDDQMEMNRSMIC